MARNRDVAGEGSENPGDVQPSHGVVINTTVTAQAPNIAAVADYFDSMAQQIADSGSKRRGGQPGAELRGKMQGYRDAAEFLRNVTITG